MLLELLLLDRLSLRDSDFLIFPIFPRLPPTGPLALVLLALPLPPDDAPMSPVLPPPVRRILAPSRRANQADLDEGRASSGEKEAALNPRRSATIYSQRPLRAASRQANRGTQPGIKGMWRLPWMPSA